MLSYSNVHFPVTAVRINVARLVLAFFLSALFSFGTAVPVQGQPRPVQYGVSTAVQGGIGGSIPFWQYANTRGRLRPGSQTNWLSEAGVTLPLLEREKFDVSAGATAVGRVSDATNTLHLAEVYGKMQYRGVRLSIGRFPETIGLGRRSLSVGPMMVSRNAPHVPKIKIATPNFLQIPFTGGHVQFRARWSDGQLGPGRDEASALLHQKTLYLKINVASIEAIGGFVQNTVWNGEDRSPEFSDYLNYVVLGRPADSGYTVRGGAGNSVAAYDFMARYATDDWRIQLRRLFYLEDSVSMRFRSPWDGIWGLDVYRTNGSGWIDGLVYEHVYTIQQDALPGAPRGRIGYYDHGTYASGWTYKGTVLGNPLIRYDSQQQEIVNNMVVAHHLGIEGTLSPRLDYSFRFTYSRNYGVCEDQIITGTCRVLSYEPPPPNQETRPRGELRTDKYSLSTTLRYLLPRPSELHLVASAGADLGAQYGNRWGVQLGFEWTGPLDPQ